MYSGRGVVCCLFCSNTIIHSQWTTCPSLLLGHDPLDGGPVQSAQDTAGALRTSGQIRLGPVLVQRLTALDTTPELQQSNLFIRGGANTFGNVVNY